MGLSFRATFHERFVLTLVPKFPGKNFHQVVLPGISQFVIFGPTPFSDKHCCSLFTTNCGAVNLRISSGAETPLSPTFVIEHPTGLALRQASCTDNLFPTQSQ